MAGRSRRELRKASVITGGTFVKARFLISEDAAREIAAAVTADHAAKDHVAGTRVERGTIGWTLRVLVVIPPSASNVPVKKVAKALQRAVKTYHIVDGED